MNILTVPDEILLNIIRGLDLSSLYQLRKTCKRFHRLSGDSSLTNGAEIDVVWKSSINDSNTLTITTTYPGGSKAEFLLGRKNLRLEEVLQAIPLKISRLQMHDFILALTGEGDEKKERQAFEQLLLRSQNIELNAVEMDQETEQLIHNLGNDGFLDHIRTFKLVGIPSNYRNDRHFNQSAAFKSIAPLSCYSSHFSLSFGTRYQNKPFSVTQSLTKILGKCSFGRLRLRNISLAFHDCQPRSWDALMESYMDRMDKMSFGPHRLAVWRRRPKKDGKTNHVLAKKLSKITKARLKNGKRVPRKILAKTVELTPSEFVDRFRNGLPKGLVLPFDNSDKIIEFVF